MCKIVDVYGGYTQFTNKLAPQGKVKMVEGLGTTQVQDVATVALERLSTRRTVYQRTKRLLLWLLVIALVSVGVSSYALWQYVITRPQEHGKDIRSCSVTVGRNTIEGERSYSYNYRDYFGFRIIDTKQISVGTTVFYRGSGLTLIGQTKEAWWSFKVKDGEIGRIKIKPAERYTVIVNDQITVVEDDTFCK